jgi:nucleoside-diphosphate-sugar epimerase
MYMEQDQEHRDIWSNVWSFFSTKNCWKPFTVVGSGNQTRDFTYVTDVVSYLKASKSKLKMKFLMLEVVKL